MVVTSSVWARSPTGTMHGLTSLPLLWLVQAWQTSIPLLFYVTLRVMTDLLLREWNTFVRESRVRVASWRGINAMRQVVVDGEFCGYGAGMSAVGPGDGSHRNGDD